MSSFFQSDASILAIIFLITSLALLGQQIKLGRILGPALSVILLGIFCTNIGLTPVDHNVYGVFFTYCVPLSISIILMGVDIKALLKLSREPFVAMLVSVLSVSFLAFLFGLIFAKEIEDGWKVAGMFVGSYTGGSPNLTAIATALGTSREAIAAANAADYVVGTPAVIFYMSLPPILKASKQFNKIWPYSFTEEELAKDDGQGEFLGSKEWSIKEISSLIAIAMIIVAASTFVSQYFPDSVKGSARLILISTVSLILSRFPFIRKLRGNNDLGLFFSLLFLTVLGLTINLKGFLSSTFYITIFCALIIIFSMIFQWVVLRILKIKYQYVLLATVAAVWDGPTSALVAGGAKWKSLMSIAIIMGIMGGVCGNYLGITVAFLIKNTLGV